MVTLNINGRDMQVDADPSTPILWALRDNLNLTGTKFGCGAALCGACTVHLNGQAIRSCVTPISAATGQKITTIEAMEADWHRHALGLLVIWMLMPRPCSPISPHAGRLRSSSAMAKRNSAWITIR